VLPAWPAIDHFTSRATPAGCLLDKLKAGALLGKPGNSFDSSSLISRISLDDRQVLKTSVLSSHGQLYSQSHGRL
jgi:hypothetical protein